jgi:glycosyltransferase involved in cell wall biosynthesis
MRVCMIAYSVYESDGRVMRYAETLAERGAEVDMVALARPGRTGDEVIHGVNVFRLQTRTHDEKGQFSYLFRILLFFFRAMWFVGWRELGERYDLVHVHSVPDFLVFIPWLAKMRGARIILDIHDVLPELYASKFGCDERSAIHNLLVQVERKSAAFADYVIIANDIWRDKLLARSVRAEKCTAILNFPNRSIFFRRGRARNDGRFVMLYPGTLNRHQGLDIAIRSLARIKDAAPNADLHIYGEGPAKESLRALAAELGLNGRVRISDARPLRGVAELMEDADLGVVPKRNDSFGDEAFSTKTLEFMAMGIPVLVSDTKIDRYYFNDSMVRFFRAGDERSLSEAMLALIQSPQVRSSLARNAAAFLEGNDWESNKSRYLKIVRHLMAGRSGEEMAPGGD